MNNDLAAVPSWTSTFQFRKFWDNASNFLKNMGKIEIEALKYDIVAYHTKSSELKIEGKEMEKFMYNLIDMLAFASCCNLIAFSPPTQEQLSYYESAMHQVIIK